MLRRIAAERPVHVVSEVSRDLLLPMGFLPAKDADQALRRAGRDTEAGTAVVLPAGTPYRSQMP